MDPRHKQTQSKPRITQPTTTIASASASSSAPATAPPPRARSKEPPHLPLYLRLLPLSPGDPLPPLLYPSPPPSRPHSPPHSPSPPSSPSSTPTSLSSLDERIYHLLALALRAYVLSWYSTRLSPRDRTLVPAITHSVLLPVLPPLLRQIPDATPLLLLVDIPTILALHIRTYRQASEALEYIHDPADDDTDDRPGGSSGSSSATPRSTSGSKPRPSSLRLGRAYHARLPLLGCAPWTPTTTAPSGPTETARPEPRAGEYALSPVYLTAMIDALLRLHLPPDDYASDAERLMVREILGRTVLWSVGRRLSQPWFWHQMLLRVLEPKTRRSNLAKGDKAASKSVAAEPSDLQPSPPTPPPRSSGSSASPTSPSPRSTNADRAKAWVQTWQLLLINLIMRLWTLATLFWSAAVWALATPPSDGPEAIVEPWLAVAHVLVGAPTWPARMVWGVVDMLVIVLGPVLDRVVPILFERIMTERTGLKVADVVERIMFPNDGYPGPSPIDPTPEEAARLRAAVVSRLNVVVPRWAKTVFFPHGVDKLIEPLDDPGCNAHLVAMLYDAIFASLVPDLVVTDPATLVTPPGMIKVKST